jgi:hypothetical protein
MTEKDLEIQKLKQEIKILKKQKENVLKYINKRCVYDEHLQGYCMGLNTGEVRTLMYELNKDQK